MSDVKFGYCVPVFANPGSGLFRTPAYQELDPSRTMTLAKLADELGYDSLWVADHLMLGKDESILEGWTVLAALAGSTTRAQLGLIHQAHFFRHPALAAKMAATLDQISGGRLIHFYDIGRQLRERTAYGLSDLKDQDGEFASMIEGLDLTLCLWSSTEPVSYQGSYFQTTGAVSAPLPLQRPHPPIWLGETDPEILEATATYAQGWNTTPVSLVEFTRRIELLQEAFDRSPRSLEEIEISVEMQVLIAPDLRELRSRLASTLLASDSESDTQHDPGLVAFVRGETDQFPESLRANTIMGTPGQVVKQLTDYVECGADHFLLWFLDAPSDEGLTLFAEEVLPAFRSASSSSV